LKVMSLISILYIWLVEGTVKVGGVW